MKNFTLILFVCISFQSIAQKDTISNETSWPLGLAEKDGILYIAEADDNEITTLNLDGSTQTPTILVSNIDRPNYLTIDGDYLYYTEHDGDKISRVDLTQSNPTPELVIDNIVLPADVLIIETDLYFSNTYGIYKLDLTNSGATPETIFETLSGPVHLLHHGNDIYFTEYIGGTISKFNYTIANPVSEPYLVGLNGPLGRMGIYDNEFYFFEFGDKNFVKVPFDAPNQSKTIIDDVITGADMLFIDNDIYVSSFQDDLILRYNDLLILGTDEFVEVEFSISPNPTSDYLNFDLQTAESYQLQKISILMADGRLISDQKYSLDSNRIDLSSIPPGTYFILFEGEGWIKTEQVIKL